MLLSLGILIRVETSQCPFHPGRQKSALGKGGTEMSLVIRYVVQMLMSEQTSKKVSVVLYQTPDRITLARQEF
jgi:hypothetical protein